MPRLSLGGEVAVTAGPVMVILTTALTTTTTTVATVVTHTHGAPIASAPTDHSVPASMYASLFLPLTASTDSTLYFSTPHPAPTPFLCSIITHHLWSREQSHFNEARCQSVFPFSITGQGPRPRVFSPELRYQLVVCPSHLTMRGKFDVFSVFILSILGHSPRR